MANVLDMFKKPQGNMSLKEALAIIKQENLQKKNEKRWGERDMINPVNTKKYGPVETLGNLQELVDFERGQRQKNIDIENSWKNLPGGTSNGSLGMGFGESAQAPSGVVDQYMPQAIPEVQGVADQYGQEGYSDYRQVLEDKGLSPVSDIVASDEDIQRFVDNAMKWAGTPQPDAQKYPYRQPDTMAENSEYVGEYIRAAMQLAPYYDLPPKTIAAMLMQESGWGGQRFDGNLGGYGFLDGGEDMGIRFPGTIEEQANGYLDKVSSDWDGRYRGSRSPQDFHEKGYNPHAQYPSDVMGVYRMLDN